MRKPTLQLTALLLLLAFAAACAPAAAPLPDSTPNVTATPTATLPSDETASPSPLPAPTPTPVHEPEKNAPLSYGAWIPYWDYADAIGEVDLLGSALQTVVGFGAIFDNQDKPFLLPDMVETQTCLNILYASEHTVYLSVVNDIEVADEIYDNKSAALLWRLLGTETTINAHIEDLMALMEASGAEGLEIDYEAINADVALWEQFVLFIDRLYARTQSAGYPLRVVLSWNAAGYASFPAGPQYSVMCYNLYGYHSGSGPKADRSFLNETYEICRSLPGSPAMAFATGGFDWGDDGSITALTQTSAENLATAYAASSGGVQRDEASGAVFFVYTKDEITHTVWYADGETLAFWRELALSAGYVNFDLFRLGCNNHDDLLRFCSMQTAAIPYQ